MLVGIVALVNALYAELDNPSVAAAPAAFIPLSP